MSQCWQEGDWRAYLDGELPDEDMVRAREHLAECASCKEVHREIAERASRISAWMADLEAAPVLAQRRAPRRSAWKWGAAAVALAAALAGAFVVAPKRVETVSSPLMAQAQPDPIITAAPPMKRADPAMAHQVSRPRGLRRAAPRPQYYLALDDQPIDTGMVMRVALENGIEADVIVDSDGRPRAIRAVH